MDEGIRKCSEWSLEVRRKIIEIAHGVGKKGVHLGSALSTVEILSVLYAQIMKYNQGENSDYFILSKGHAYLGLYAVLCQAGYFSLEDLKKNFMVDDGLFPVHPIKNIEKGIEFSGGSLGMGMSFAVGKAYALKLAGRKNKVFTLLGDGECNEGIVWEAFMAASHMKLFNLVAIIDKNSLQQDGWTKEVIDVDIEKMAGAAGWEVAVVDGHSVTELLQALGKERGSGMPLCIIANTVKGKGISFMENDNYWHHAFMTEKQYSMAIEELK